MGKLNSDLMECKKYSENIMNDVAAILDQENIEFTSDSSNTELTIHNCEKTRDEIQDLIESSLEIPKMITAMLIMIKKTQNLIFIRLKRR